MSVAINEEVAAGLRHDAVGRGQAHAFVRLRVLRREVRHEGSADNFRRHAAAIVGHPDANVFAALQRSEEHTSELQSLMRISYAVFCLKKKKELHIIKKSTNKLIKHL